MNWKKAVTIGTAALCTVAFNGCVVAPANGYGPGVYVPPIVVPNVYVGPRPAPYYPPRVAPYWGAPRYAPPAPHWGGGWGGGGWGRGGGWHHR